VGHRASGPRGNRRGWKRRAALPSVVGRPGRCLRRAGVLGGRRIRSLVEAWREAGRPAETWDGRAQSGGPTLAGVYLLRLEVDGRTLTRRVVRMR
jgi:hypothetical protein